MSTDSVPQASTTYHYYDRHPTPEDLLGESAIQDQVICHFVDVLRWMFRAAPAFVARNLNIYTQRRVRQLPLAPDIALFQDVQITAAALPALTSWRIYEPDRPPPMLVIEVASRATWKIDLRQKPRRYAALGVQEYLLVDPNIPACLPGSRLRLWQQQDGAFVPVVPDTRGWVWSNLLASWVVAEPGGCRLVDRQGSPRLTEAQVERAAKEAERAAKEVERAAKEAERAAKEAERTAKEAERAAKEAAWAKLRELGIDPETLSG